MFYTFKCFTVGLHAKTLLLYLYNAIKQGQSIPKESTVKHSLISTYKDRLEFFGQNMQRLI